MMPIFESADSFVSLVAKLDPYAINLLKEIAQRSPGLNVTELARFLPRKVNTGVANTGIKAIKSLKPLFKRNGYHLYRKERLSPEAIATYKRENPTFKPKANMALSTQIRSLQWKKESKQNTDAYNLAARLRSERDYESTGSISPIN